MKAMVKRVESTDAVFTKKDKTTVAVNVTSLVCDVPFNENEMTNERKMRGFGVKEMSYQVGTVADYANFDKFNLDKLEGVIPCELEIELGQGTNQYNQPCTCVTEIKLPPKAQTVVKS